MDPNSLFDKDRDRQNSSGEKPEEKQKEFCLLFCVVVVFVHKLHLFFPSGCVPAGVCVNAAPVSHSGSCRRFLAIHAQAPRGSTFPEGARPIVLLLKPSRRAHSRAPRQASEPGGHDSEGNLERNRSSVFWKGEELTFRQGVFG